MFLTVYHYLNVCYYGGPMLSKKTKKKLGQNTLYHIKLRLLQMLLILIMNKNLTLHPISSYDQMCISKRQKSDIIIINVMRQPKPVS